MSDPARAYEGYMVPALFAPWAVRLVETAQPENGETVLDLACGTGIVARTLAGRAAAEISALDLSPAMLSVASETARDEGFEIEWHEGQAENLPFPDGKFDLVLCQFGLMFFADAEKALSECFRVLKNGGRFCLSVWQKIDEHPFYKKLDAVIRERLGMSDLQNIFALGDAFRLEKMLTGAGFHRVSVEPVSMISRFPDPESFLAGEIAVDTAAIPSMQSLDEQARADIINAISEEMRAPLDEVTRNDHVELEFHAFITQAKR